MTTEIFLEQPDEKYDTTNLVSKQILKIILFILVLAILLFVSSGRVMWAMTWVYICVYTYVSVYAYVHAYLYVYDCVCI